MMTSDVDRAIEEHDEANEMERYHVVNSDAFERVENLILVGIEVRVCLPTEPAKPIPHFFFLIYHLSTVHFVHYTLHTLTIRPTYACSRRVSMCWPGVLDEFTYSPMRSPHVTPKKCPLPLSGCGRMVHGYPRPSPSFLSSWVRCQGVSCLPPFEHNIITARPD
jgi:hypothetical protein